MIYALDTNVCIALINGKTAKVRDRFRQTLSNGADMRVSSVVAFELWYGVAKSARRELNAERVEAFFAGPVELWPVEDDDARAAGAIRGAMELAGTPIGAYDVIIAGQALQRGAILVTSNVKEFNRVEGLTCEDWAV